MWGFKLIKILPSVWKEGWFMGDLDVYGVED